MSILFKKLSQGSEPQSKLRKYGIYAIGEIILIVIGILVAMQINNWNQFNKDRQKEAVALGEIAKDIDNNIEQLNLLISDDYNEEKRLNALSIVIDHLDQQLPYHDSLNLSFWYILNLGSATFMTSGYESLRSIGMDLIDDDELRSNLGNYYNMFVPGAKFSFNELRDDFYNYMLEYVRKDFVEAYVKVDDAWTPGMKPIDYDRLIEDHEFVQSLKVYWPLLSNFVLAHKDVQEYAKEMKLMIEERQEELNK